MNIPGGIRIRVKITDAQGRVISVPRARLGEGTDYDPEAGEFTALIARRDMIDPEAIQAGMSLAFGRRTARIIAVQRRANDLELSCRVAAGGTP
jgi:hypothetical protein